MLDGWIKLHRKILDSDLNHYSATTQIIFVKLLLLCAYAERSVLCLKCKAEITVCPGELLFTYQRLADRVRFSINTMRKALTELTSIQAIEIEHSAPCHHIIRVNNWVDYQAGDQNLTACDQNLTAIRSKNDHLGDQNLTAIRSKNDHLGDQNLIGDLIIRNKKEYKNSAHHAQTHVAKNSTRKPKQQTIDAVTLPTEAWRIAELHRTLLLRYQPKHSCGGSRHSQRRWASAYHEFTLTGCSEPVEWAELEKIVRYALEDSEDWSDGTHWRDRCGSPTALLRHWDTLCHQRETSIIAENEMLAIGTDEDRKRAAIEAEQRFAAVGGVTLHAGNTDLSTRFFGEDDIDF